MPRYDCPHCGYKAWLPEHPCEEADLIITIKKKYADDLTAKEFSFTNDEQMIALAMLISACKKAIRLREENFEALDETEQRLLEDQDLMASIEERQNEQDKQ